MWFSTSFCGIVRLFLQIGTNFYIILCILTILIIFQQIEYYFEWISAQFCDFFMQIWIIFTIFRKSCGSFSHYSSKIVFKDSCFHGFQEIFQKLLINMVKMLVLVIKIIIFQKNCFDFSRQYFFYTLLDFFQNSEGIVRNVFQTFFSMKCNFYA